MTAPTPPDSDAQRKLIWASVYRSLIQHAHPDARFNYDFLSFTPDFSGSSSAIARLATLPCYQSAATILATPDNSLSQLRHQALKDGKKVLVATYRLRRGFVLLHPGRIAESKFELAACLDGMEKAGIGRSISLAEMRDEGLKVDMCVTGGLVFNAQGVTIWEGHNLFEVQWALLHDLGVLQPHTPVVAVAHDCQVVDETLLGVDKVMPTREGEVQSDFVVTPEQFFQIENAVKPSGGVDFDKVDPEGVQNIPPLQELRGIRMMEKIMQREGFTSSDKKEEKGSEVLDEDEQLGVSIVEKLMQSYRA
jgi:5-formyltetrahydrofolate cyclo-ligase